MSTQNDNVTSLSFSLFLTWTFVLFGRPQEYLTFLQPLRIALIFLLLNLVVVLSVRERGSWENIFKIKEAKRYILLYLLMIIGIPFADHRGMAFEFVFFKYANNVIYFLIFLYLVDSFDRLKKIIYLICLSILFYGGAGLFRLGPSYGRLKFGTMHDPNDLAVFFISLFPLCIFLIKTNKHGIKKMIAAAAVALSIITIILTGSRGGFVSFAIVLVLIIFSKAGGLKRSDKITVIISTVLLLIIFSNKIDFDRYATLLDLSEDYNITRETGRLEVWKAGLELSLSNPFTGVGVTCFARALGYYRADKGTMPKWQTAHNSYLLILAEVGVPGFIVFLSIISVCLKTFLRFMKSRIAKPDMDEIRMLSGLILISFIGHLVGVFFLSQTYGVIFTLFFALSGVIAKFETEI